MPYSAPSTESMLFASAHLIDLFNQRAMRYIAPSLPMIRSLADGLGASYIDKLKQKTTLFFRAAPDPRRLAQVKMITDLIETFPHDIESEKQKQYVLHVILGAMIYQMRSIAYEYEGTTSAMVGRDEANSALYIALKEAMNISTTNELDSLTEWSCLQSYSEYIQLPSNRERFGGLQKDSRFLMQMSLFISRKHRLAKPYIDELDAIKMLPIEQLANFIKDVEQQLLGALGGLAHRLQDKSVSHWSKEALLTLIQEAIPGSWQKEYWSYLFPPEATFDNTKSEIDKFVSHLKDRLNIHTQYALLGVYLYAYEKTEPTSPLTRMMLRQIIGLSDTQSIDNETRTLALIAFDNILLANEGAVTHFGLWGRGDQLSRSLQESLEMDSAFELVALEGGAMASMP